MALFLKAVWNGPSSGATSLSVSSTSGLVAFVQERQYMRHVRVFSQPVCWFYNIPVFLVTYHARRFPEFSFRILTFLGIQHVTVLVIGFSLIIDKKVNAGSQNVYGRSLEELVASTATFFFPFL